jgi:putative membrane protein
MNEELTMMQSTIFSEKKVALARALMLCGTLAWAGQAPGQTRSMDAQMNGINSGEASQMDKMFVIRELQSSMAEVQLGQLTLQKTNNEQMKQFAQKMIDDHSKLGDQMKTFAQQIGVDIPTQVSKKDKETMAKLQALSGTEYEQAYIKATMKDHKKDLSEFQMEASTGQDQAVKDAASQLSQVIEQHLQMIEQIAKDQKATQGGQ